MRRVVLTAMCGKWPEATIPAGTELWGVNRTATVEPRLSRVYTFDPECLFQPGYVEHLAELGIPVFTRSVHPDIPQSIRFPKEEIVHFFNGLTYSTCTVAWMLQHAIYEHQHGDTIDELVLANMFLQRDSMEYLWCLPCVNFWVGVAMGCGMKVVSHGHAAVVKALPWESNEYGYRRNVYADTGIATLAAAYRACYEYPRKFMTADDELALTEDWDSLTQIRDQARKMLEQAEAQLADIEKREPQPC